MSLSKGTRAEGGNLHAAKEKTFVRLQASGSRLQVTKPKLLPFLRPEV